MPVGGGVALIRPPDCTEGAQAEGACTQLGLNLELFLLKIEQK